MNRSLSQDVENSIEKIRKFANTISNDEKIVINVLVALIVVICKILPCLFTLGLLMVYSAKMVPNS